MFFAISFLQQGTVHYLKLIYILVNLDKALNLLEGHKQNADNLRDRTTKKVHVPFPNSPCIYLASFIALNSPITKTEGFKVAELKAVVCP